MSRHGLSGAPAIQVTDLRVRYERAEAPALDGVSLHVPPGGYVLLIGPNGSGKSTLLKAIMGLLPAQAGDIRIFGTTLAASRRRIAYLPQVSELDWRFPVDVERLVLTGRYVHLGWWQRPGRKDVTFAREALGRVGAGDLAGRQIGQLSGGQRQRILLARALAQKADILLLDEPFNAVDAASRAVLLQVLHDLHRAGTTLVIATHDQEREALPATEVVQLQQGRRVDLEASRSASLAEIGSWSG